MVETKALLDRVERGELSRAQLEIAAHLGHTAARQALGLGGTAPADWLGGLSHWGQEAMIRAGIACAQWMLPTPLGEDLQPIVSAVDAATTWIRDPSEANRVGARLACEELEALAAGLSDGEAVDEELLFEIQFVAGIVAIAADSRPQVAEHHFAAMLERLWEGLPKGEQDEARQVIEQSLLAWALGEDDPLDDGV